MYRLEEEFTSLCLPINSQNKTDLFPVHTEKYMWTFIEQDHRVLHYETLQLLLG